MLVPRTLPPPVFAVMQISLGTRLPTQRGRDGLVQLHIKSHYGLQLIVQGFLGANGR